MITHDRRRSLPRGNALVPSRWQATLERRDVAVGDHIADRNAVGGLVTAEYGGLPVFFRGFSNSEGMRAWNPRGLIAATGLRAPVSSYACRAPDSWPAPLGNRTLSIAVMMVMRTPRVIAIVAGAC
jgi:hypothetical protein